MGAETVLSRSSAWWKTRRPPGAHPAAGGQVLTCLCQWCCWAGVCAAGLVGCGRGAEMALIRAVAVLVITCPARAGAGHPAAIMAGTGVAAGMAYLRSRTPRRWSWRTRSIPWRSTDRHADRGPAPPDGVSRGTGRGRCHAGGGGSVQTAANTRWRARWCRRHKTVVWRWPARRRARRAGARYRERGGWGSYLVGSLRWMDEQGWTWARWARVRSS